MPSGSRLGSYEILALVGAGAMGEVYRARDARLGRDVAVKVLPRELTADPERLARFEREARVLAALNHPNIATIHGVEEEGDVRALVMELVDGETLAELSERPARGGRVLPVAEALGIARQIAAALEAAHDSGIVHRDLKPANVKVNKAGVVKLLDFGLAKVSNARDGTPEAAAVTQLAAADTFAGAMLGTAAYMSPEQARGFPVDQSVDVWAFACVLYELLTGRRAFEGATLSDTIAAVLEHEPDWTKLPATVPGPVRRLVHRCLNKDPRQRLRDIGAVRILVEDALVALDSASSMALDAHAARPRGAGFAWVAAGIAGAALALGATAAYLWTRPPPLGETLRVSITAPGPISPQLSGAISPDGRHLAFVATGPSGRSMLWVRTLDSLEPRELPGTEGAAHPFWSPDSLSLGFIAEAKLKRVELTGGAVQTLADTDGTWRSGGSWSREGIIVFAPSPAELAAVPAAGGSTTTLLTIDPANGQERLHWPDFLPDGRHFLYYSASREPEHRGVYVGSLDSEETKRVLESDVRAKYAAPGYLLYLREGTLYAQPFDTERLELTGEPRAIADGVWSARTANHASFSASQTGTLAYVNATFNDRQLVWFDRNGRRAGIAGPVFAAASFTPELAPDGRRIALTRGDTFFGDVWLLDSGLETFSRITFSPAFRGAPIWAGNGEALIYGAGDRIVRGNLEDASEETLLEASDSASMITDWSQDGRYIVLMRDTDIWIVDLNGGESGPYLETPANEAQAQLSPNGQWIAYSANETGRDEVYVQSFPSPGRKRQISVDGGAAPRWRGDGGELYFLAADQTMMAVPIADAASLHLGPPVPLFRAPLVVQGSESFGLSTSYDVSPDGQRFLLMQPPENPAPPMTVVLNWRGALL